ncbi:hypothetical protein CONLIGDRAFT_147954 [Coniochaeta ligniaria NRRL 30616]|uniref:Uncharacterized protein n=1 Tax=Coniochaeta ligniaria NRRL 30616 TaxID=1408157 RepID=A0A1J7I5D7_9PEZI|nr:hypothetical protein CONLIGDRAFT_147954 [Coniochaeta ligniaria NRRL 30616]
MASRNPDSLDHQDQFHARVPPTQTHGGRWHKPGNEQGKEAIPEFHAQTYPPGTAPPESTYQPHNTYETPVEGGPVDYPGATSQDVYNATGVQEGRPLQGQTGRELHGAHPGKRKKERSGLEGVGATGRDEPTVERKVREGAFDKEEAAKGQRGKSGAAEGGMAWEGVEAAQPYRAEHVSGRKT